MVDRQRCMMLGSDRQAVREDAMDFALSAEQEMIVSDGSRFRRNRDLSARGPRGAHRRSAADLAQEIKRKVIEMGFYACNFPEEVGGGGLGHLDFTLVERELGRGSMALTHFFGRPQNILMACEGDQKEKYLFPRCGASGWMRWR
jgi:acyl-CoA dehydrogenase